MPLRTASAAVAAALRQAGLGLVERTALLETLVLAAVAGEHALVIGPPGTAKSEAVRRLAGGFGGRYFEYLLGRFTEPSELFGPIDLRRLKEGVVVTETTGMLPEADIAFLDEIFQGSTAILNTLLGILNERTFRRGHTQLRCPLRICVGAANTLPTDDTLAAFADRFLVRCFVHEIPDPQLEELLEQGWTVRPSTPSPAATLADLDVLSSAALAADVSPARPMLAQAVRRLRKEGIALSDRRIVKIQKLAAAAAVLDGRTVVGAADLWPAVLVVPTEDGQQIARQCLRELLAGSENSALLATAEETSHGPAARARRLLQEGASMLADDAVDDEASILRLEGLGREIDATFPSDALSADLADVRRRLQERLDRYYAHV